MCVFCKIIAGDLPALKVYEDHATLVIMDIADDVDGHMVAMPKKHVESFLDCDKATLDRLMETVRGISTRCVMKCGYDGVNLLNASGESAGQSVPHLHIHIIPRKHGDGIDAWPRFDGAKCKREEIFEKLKI